MASLWVAIAGFVAISDDDYARTVIAQQFYFEPKWDPSGTTWLPFPFWMTGAWMRLTGPHVVSAQVLSWLLSMASAWAVYVAARWLELTQRSALLGALGAAVLPHAVWLGIATVPDGYTAALALLAIASTASGELRRRALGAALISLAALSRYEVWSLSVFVAACAAWDGVRLRRPAFGAVALLALLGPMLWLLHGVFTYDDPVFFVSRVASYRQMLGRSATSLSQALLTYPRALICAEPELALLAGSALPLLLQRKLPSTLLRPALGALALLAFLIWGNLRDGAPTHHPERPLLTIWLFGCLLAAVSVSHWYAQKKLWLGLALPALLTVTLLRPWFTRRDSFADRAPELQLGARAKELAAGHKLLVDSGDYGYFAVIAAFEAPHLAAGVVDSDPRQAKLVFADPAARLRHHIGLEHAAWAVLQRSTLPQLGAVGRIAAESDRLVLVELDPNYVTVH
jgi:hypothetical protein